MAAGVSGGADSLALLVLASQAGLAVTAIHVDHGLRPDSHREAEIVATVAARVGAGFERRHVTVAPGPDLEARARRARYAALPAGVLVGHTADDQAETVLLNLIRGAGLDGLAGMAPTRCDNSALHPSSGDDPSDALLDARVRRPLLGLRRAETTELCAALGWDVVHDQSNEDLRFRRNQVRHRLLPLLNEIAGRDVVAILARQAGLMRAEAALLDRLAESIDPTDTRVLRRAPEPLARRALRDWLRDAGGDERHPPSSAAVDRVLAVVRGEATGCELPGGARVRRSRGRLTLAGPGRPGR